MNEDDLRARLKIAENYIYRPDDWVEYLKELERKGLLKIPGGPSA